MDAKVDPIPKDMYTITPHLVCEGAADAIEFYKKAFGAVETMRLPGPNGRVMHAAVKIGDSTIMLADDFPEYGGLGPKALKGSPVTLHMYVTDTDAAYQAGHRRRRHRQDAAGRHVLGRPLRPGHRSFRPSLVDRHPHQGRHAGRNERGDEAANAALRLRRPTCDS
jgi:catechol 2,3-dioxygenase-like lactoylglutathione lyase family enzyme